MSLVLILFPISVVDPNSSACIHSFFWPRYSALLVLHSIIIHHAGSPLFSFNLDVEKSNGSLNEKKNTGGGIHRSYSTR